MDKRCRILLNRKTGRAVKAILPVHVFGLPCYMDFILELANEFGLRVLEDACEALGADCDGRRVGTFGDAAVFAFYPNKQMTTGEGGMIVTDDPQIAKLCRSLRNQGRDDDSSWLRHVHLGYNYRLSEIHCALGLAQLSRLDELLCARERVATAYARALSRVPNILLPAKFDGLTRSWFVYVVQLDLPDARTIRDRTILRLREHGIESQAYFPAIHKQPYIADTALVPPSRSLTFTEEASERCLALPFFPSMTDEEIRYVSETLTRVLQDQLRPQSATAPAWTAVPEVSA
jgi:perosamine synthetase